MISEFIAPIDTGTRYIRYFAGKTAEIKAMYKSIARNKNVDIIPLYADSPRFSPKNSFYGLKIDEEGYMTIISPSTMLGILLNT